MSSPKHYTEFPDGVVSPGMLAQDPGPLGEKRWDLM
jgi:hypothetical protein